MSDPTPPDAHSLYRVLQDGGLALVPTLTGYGLVGMTADAVGRIYRLKSRPAEKPCVTVGSLAVLDDVAVDIEPAMRDWIASTSARWPLALVVRRNPHSTLVAQLDPFVLSQCTKGDTIASFFGVGPLLTAAAALALADGRLIIGSSANQSGAGNAYTLDDVPETMRQDVDLLVSHPPPPSSPTRQGSTLLDLTSRQILRRGVFVDAIEQSWMDRWMHPAGAEL